MVRRLRSGRPDRPWCVTRSVFNACAASSLRGGCPVAPTNCAVIGSLAQQVPALFTDITFTSHIKLRPPSPVYRAAIIWCPGTFSCLFSLVGSASHIILRLRIYPSPPFSGTRYSRAAVQAIVATTPVSHFLCPLELSLSLPCFLQVFGALQPSMLLEAWYCFPGMIAPRLPTEYDLDVPTSALLALGLFCPCVCQHLLWLFALRLLSLLA